MVGDKEALNEAIDQIESTFNIKIEENEYLGCEFLVSENNKKGWLGQPYMSKSLSKKGGDLMEKIQTLKTN